MSLEIKIKVGVLVQKTNKLLLIKELDTSRKQYYWNLIKGTFEPEKDKNLFAAALRECLEETGIQVNVKRILNIFYLKKPTYALLQFNFLGETKDNPKLASKRAQKRRGENISEFRWFSKENINKLKKPEFMNSRTFVTVKEWTSKKSGVNLNILNFLKRD